MTSSAIGRPDASEFASWQAGYIGLVPGDDPVAALQSATPEALAFYRAIDDVAATRRYARDKWSIKQVLGHVIDTERIFGYRLLRIARGDKTPLPPFEQDDYVATARSDERSWSDMVAELEALRRSHISMLCGLSAGDWLRQGTVSGAPATARALAFVLAGHEMHHRKILAEKYLVSGAPSGPGGTATS